MDDPTFVALDDQFFQYFACTKFQKNVSRILIYFVPRKTSFGNTDFSDPTLYISTLIVTSFIVIGKKISLLAPKDDHIKVAYDPMLNCYYDPVTLKYYELA